MTGVCITHIGIISALGEGPEAQLMAFKEHRSGIRLPEILKTRHSKTFPVGEVSLTNGQLAQKTGLDERLSRTILLSALAVQQIIENVDLTKFKPHRIGFISASTIGGMDKTEDFFVPFIQDNDLSGVSGIRNHDCGKPTDFVARHFGLTGFVSTVSTACSSSANALMLGARLLKQNKLDIVIAGGVDALTRFTLNGFNTLMIVDKEQCRPLDQNRQGLNLGEGAAYVVLMRENEALKHNYTSLGKLTGYANTNDGYHQTALSDQGNGPYTAMQKALEVAHLKPEDIHYVNMHGTGTQNNDMAESAAMDRVFHGKFPPLSSTKSFTGHTLAASGSIEAVFSLLCLNHQCLLPNFLFETPMEGTPLIPVSKFKDGERIQHVLSNSFGFGGNCSSLIFSKS